MSMETIPSPRPSLLPTILPLKLELSGSSLQLQTSSPADADPRETRINSGRTSRTWSSPRGNTHSNLPSLKPCSSHLCVCVWISRLWMSLFYMNTPTHFIPDSQTPQHCFSLGRKELVLQKICII